MIATPYVTSSVRGLIYEASDGSISLRNVEHLNNSTGRWSPISRVNSTLEVNIPGGAIIVKENRVINASGLVNGDLVRVMTPALEGIPEPGASLDGIIVRVDR